MRKIYALLLVLLVANVGWGQVNYVTGTYTQDFNTLAATTGTGIAWTNNTTLSGWHLFNQAGGGTALTTYSAETGSTGTATFSSYGATSGGTERALGSIGSGGAYWGSPASGAIAGWMAIQIVNGSGSTLNSFTLNFNGEQWRNGGNISAQTMVFEYGFGATFATVSSWTAPGGNFDWASVVTGASAAAVNGNVAGLVSNRGGTITGLTWTNGQTLWLRWVERNDTGNDHALAIDDLSFSASASSTPDIALSSPNPAVNAGNISQGSTNNVIYRFDLAVTTATATLTGVTVTTAGTYAAADLSNLKCWYSADATFNSGTDVLLSTKSTALGAGAHVFPSFTSQNISSGTTGYIFITADLACTAVIGNTILITPAISTTDITFASGNKSGSAFAGDAQTVVAGTPNNATGSGATNGNTVSSVSWTNPTGCYDAILIVAAAGSTNIGIPVGDGTAYTGVLAFGAGTILGNGFVVYNSTTPVSPQVVTALTNGTTYYFKIFTRLGTTWSSGVEVSATPQAPTVYTWIGNNSAWTMATSWSPTRTTPDVADILQFNDAGTWTVTAVPTQTIGNLLVTGNTTITLQSSAANTVTIAGGTGTDFNIAAGSTLNSDGANAITLALSTGATGSIAGNMTFSGGAHRLTSADNNSVTFASGSTFTTGTGFSGNPFGTTNFNTIVFANGSIYNHNAGSNPFGAVFPNSVVTFQTGSLFRMLVDAAPSLSGRTYANFEVNAATFNQSPTGTNPLTLDNLTVTDGIFNINLTGGINIKGNISVAAGETLTFTPASAATITFNGTTAQSITNNGTLSFGSNASVSVSNTSANVVLNTNAQFNNLTITTSANLNLNGQTLSVTGSMTNGGTLTTNLGTVDFTSASGTQTLNSGGTGAGKTFYNLTHSGAGTIDLSTNNLRVVNNFTNNAGPFTRNTLNLTVGGNFSCTGTYTTGTGTLTFDGTANQNWSGNLANNYGDVIINKSSGNVPLGNAITVDNITLTSGKVELDANNLTITNSASGGSSTSYIMTNSTGTITINNISVAAKSFPMGNSTYNPLIIANGSGHNWTAKITDAVVGVIAPYNIDGAVQRTWTITPSTNPPSAGADLTFQWDGTDPSQVGPLYNNANPVQLWHYTSAWLAASASLPQAGPPNARTLTRTGWTQFSDFAISNTDHPLPVLLASFSGYRDGSRNQLRWTTATEVNNQDFEVQRSADGTNFSPIGFVNSLATGGNSADALSYAFTDNAPAGDKQYYRLRQVDLAGVSKLSQLVLIRGGKPNIVSIEALFPNPARNLVNLVVAAPKKETITLLVTDMAGRNLLQKTVNVETGSNTVPLDISALQSGSYLVRVICSEGCEGSVRFVK